MMLPLRARIGSVVFQGAGRFGATGFFIEPDGFDGWEGGAPVRREEILRPSAHGAFDVPGFLSPRVVSISGNIVADSPQRRRHMRDQLVGLLADGQSGRLVVDELERATWANVRLTDATRAKTRGRDGETSRFQIQFWAPDPRKYGEQRDFAGGEKAFHYGNFPCVPSLVMAGNVPGGYTITGPGGRQIIVTAALGASGHVIDMMTGALYVGGARVMGALTKFEPWAIPPGQQVIATASAGTLTVQATDTYI